MKLTKNEKKVLKLLLENARITDSLIASKLKISSQAVGKIRRKLENTLIDSYTININFSKIGLKVFAISISKLTSEGLDKGELQIEEKLNSIENIIQVHRVPNSSCTHIILYAFKDIEELDNFFHSQKNKDSLLKYLENKELYTFSNHSLLKNNPHELFKKIIDETENFSRKNKIKEIEEFKKRLT